MNPLLAVHTQSIIEHIRLLEAVVTAPLGLHSDIKMLRESLPLAAAADLPRHELRQRRIAYASLHADPRRLAISAAASISVSLDILESAHDDVDAARLTDGWTARARMVLSRAEAQVAGAIRADIAARVRGLYVIVDPESTQGRDVLEVAAAALRGGASVLQLRDKTRDKGEALAAARELKSMCDAHNALLIINDDADIAAACGAHGLHVGQTDLPVADARRILESTQLIGRSNNGVEEALESQLQGADYIAVGAVFPTATMGKSGRTSVGAEMISKVKATASPPVVAIGGINARNIAAVARAGADCICVVSAVTHATNPEAAAGALVGLMEGAGG